MEQSKAQTFTYESARHKTLMDEYSKLSSQDEFTEWGEKAPIVGAYMHQTLARVAFGIKTEKERSQHESDKVQKQGIEMATMQLENFHKIIQKQLDDLVEVMDKLPSGSVKSKYEDLIKPWSPKPNTPYVKILVNKSGEVLMNDAVSNLDLLKEALRKLAQDGGLVLYAREVVDGVETPTVAEAIMRIIIDNRLPVRLCKEINFSDAIDENGKLHLK